VIEVRPLEHLALRTRFVFSPKFAAQDPHRTDWDIVRLGSGCRVRTSWQAGDVVAGLFEAEAENHLRALRLAVDPAARAALVRLDSIGEIEVRDVTPDVVADYQAFFDHDAFQDYPSWQACYCMEPHRTETDEGVAPTAAENRQQMSAMISRREVTALLAYVDGKPVGWCNYGETTRLGGVVHRYGLEAADHEGVGSIACFVIASPYRGHGVASRLLDAAIERLRKKGLRAVEAYPGRAVHDRLPQLHFRGPLSMYLRAGFEPYRENDRHLIVRKAL
jgi:GNAT superfamily N-acetyltransferase